MLGQGQAWSLSPDHVIRNDQTDHVCQVTKVGVWVGGRLPSAEAWGGGIRAQRVERVDVLSSAPAARTSPASLSPPPPVWPFLRLSASDAHRLLRVPAGLRSSVLVAVSAEWSRVTVGMWWHARAGTVSETSRCVLPWPPRAHGGSAQGWRVWGSRSSLAVERCYAQISASFRVKRRRDHAAGITHLSADTDR